MIFIVSYVDIIPADALAANAVRASAGIILTRRQYINLVYAHFN